tara:strand:+ start:293 stop:475 length:183 start_codon:yes stop_codon:yes gene_type:complete
MKYKVVIGYDDSAGAGRLLGLSSCSFYKLNVAQSAAFEWTELGSGRVAYLWDGSGWTSYT